MNPLKEDTDCPVGLRSPRNDGSCKYTLHPQGGVPTLRPIPRSPLFLFSGFRACPGLSLFTMQISVVFF